MNTYREIPNLVKIDQQYCEFYRERQVSSIVTANINQPQNHICAVYSNLKLLTVICSSTIHTEHILAFPLQQWIREHVTTSRYTQTVCLFYIALLKLQRFLAI